MTLLLLVACNSEPDHARVARDCADELSAWTPTAAAADVVSSLRPRCASTLGESIGPGYEDLDELMIGACIHIEDHADWAPCDR